MKILIYIIAGFIFLSIVYGLNLFVVYSFYNLASAGLNYFTYILPMIIFLVFLIPMLITKKINELLYSVLYVIFATYLGHLVNTSLFCIIYQILRIFINNKLNDNSILGYFILLILPIIYSIYGVINAHIITIENIHLKTDKILEKPVTIAHLSDLHLGAMYKRKFVEKVVNKLRLLNPDIIVITGDLTDGSYKLKYDWIEPFDLLNIPILYITGNHESIHGLQDALNVINKSKIKHLRNEIIELCGINFMGIDYNYNYFEILDNNIQTLTESKIPNILLVHVPNVKLNYFEKYNIFLLLAGHTHGGQIFPLHIPTYFGNKYFSGLYNNNNVNYAYISSGVGAANVPMRTFCRSVIGMIKISH